MWILMVLCLLSTRPALPGEAWPEFRGANGAGLSPEDDVPLTWSEREHVRWKTALPGSGNSSPVILGDQVWLTTALDDGHSLRALAVDRNTGRIRTNVEVFHVVSPESITGGVNGHAAPTPVVEAGRVYVSFGTYGCACLDTDTGRILWHNQTLTVDHDNNGPGSSPIVHGDFLILNCDGATDRYVAALRKETGRLAWLTKRSNSVPGGNESKSFSTPLSIRVNSVDQIVTVGSRRVSALSPKDGRELWFCDLPGFTVVPRPVFGGGLIFVCTGFPKAELRAIRIDGRGRVFASRVVWRASRQIPQVSSPLVVGDRIYFVSDNGIASCLRAADGRELWSERIGGSHQASPVAAGGRIYFFDQAGVTTVMAAEARAHILAKNSLNAGFTASAAIAGNAFYLRTKTHLYCIAK